jgi:hypothetical protein
VEGIYLLLGGHCGDQFQLPPLGGGSWRTKCVLDSLAFSLLRLVCSVEQ